MINRPCMHKILMALAAVAVVGAVTLPLGACGIKSVPHAPEGATYPRQYPAPEGKSVKGEPGAERRDTTTGPLGFPYEYPNRR